MREASWVRDNAARVAHFGDVSISELRASHSASIGRSVSTLDDRHTLPLLFVLNGDIRVSQCGLQLRLGALEWSICSPDPVALSASDNVHALVMRIPGSISATEREVIHSATRGLGNVLLTCMKSALSVADELTSQARAELGNSLLDLARLAIHERTVPARRISGRGIMRERVKAFVRRHLRDSNLSIDDIAQTFHCTKRYLHKVFSEDERSLNQYIWDMRLERCSHDLADSELLERSIMEIAFVWGFRSPPHFSRVFRQRFGTSPSTYRSQHQSLLPASSAQAV